MLRFTLLLMLSISAVAQTAEVSDSLLQFIAGKLKQNRHFTAPFTQKRYMAMFEKPLISEGTINYLYPDNIRIEYVTPFESVILLTENSINRYRIENGKYIKQPSLEIVAKAITKEIIRYVSGEFISNGPYRITSASGAERHFILTPTNAAVKAIFDRIELFFPADPTYVQKVKLVETSNDSIVIEHEPPSFEPVPDSVFSIR
ncbi:MAG: outer membrane lipoprotein carrier protein LolA [Fibrobacterota bacterium]